MTCASALAQIGEFLDRELPSGPHAAVRAHLSACWTCSRAFAFQARLIAGLRFRVRDVPAPPGLARRVGNLLREVGISGRRPPSHPPW